MSGVASIVSLRRDIDTCVGLHCYADSDIIQLNAFRSNVVVLDTLEAANELLDRRSTLYSGRLAFHILGLSAV